MSVLVSLSIVFYLLLPYYLGLLTTSKKTVYNHIFIWCVCNVVFCILFSLKEKEIVTVPLLVLAIGLFYFFFSYLFYGKSLQNDAKTKNFELLITNKSLLFIMNIIMSIIILFALVLLFYMINRKTNFLYIIYFFVLIVVSCVESLIYYKTLQKQ